MSRQKAFYKVQVQNTDDTVKLLSDSVERALKPLAQNEFLDGVIINNIALSTVPKRVEHKLSRKFLGYVILRQDAAQTVYAQTDSREDLFVKLVATGDVTVSIWIF